MRAGTSEAIGRSEAELTNRPPRAAEGRRRLPATSIRPPPKRRTAPHRPARGLIGLIRIACLVRVLPASLGTYRRLSPATPGGARGSVHLPLCRQPCSATFHERRDQPWSKTARRRRRAGGGPGQAGRALLSPSGVEPRARSSGPGLGSEVRLPWERRAAAVRAGLHQHPAVGWWRSVSLRGAGCTCLHTNLTHGKLLGRLSASVKS